MQRLRTPITTFVLEDNDTVESVPSGTCYIIAKNGMFMKTTQDMYSAVRKVDSIPGLAEVKETTRASYPRIPLGLVVSVADFFRKVYDKFKSEACIVLYYSREKNKWYVDVPVQQVSGGSVKYASDILKMEGFLRIGSIHSHADFQAFHSGVDDKDEKSFDGIHMTIGHVNSDERSYSVRLMCGEKEMKLDFIDSLSDVEYDYNECPPHWLENVTEYKYVAPVTTYPPGYPAYDGMDEFGGRYTGGNFRRLNEAVTNVTTDGKKRGNVRRKSDKLTDDQKALVEIGVQTLPPECMY